jgi:hypothetical protein
MAQVISHKGIKDVKNLGWLVRHAREVASISIFRENTWEAELVACLGTGEQRTFFIIKFASYSVACDWVHRPSLRGVPLALFENEILVARGEC